MTIAGVFDTTILVHLFRGSKVAKSWLNEQSDLAVTTISRMEFIYGSRGKNAMSVVIALLNTFESVALIDGDQAWAEQQLIMFRLSHGHGVEINDCLIASICHRLQVPTFTQNVKDM